MTYQSIWVRCLAKARTRAIWLYPPHHIKQREKAARRMAEKEFIAITRPPTINT